MCKHHTRKRIPRRLAASAATPILGHLFPSCRFLQPVPCLPGEASLPRQKATTTHKGIFVSLTLHHITFLCQSRSLTFRNSHSLHGENVAHRCEYCIELPNQQMFT
uniref:PPUP7497 n=1 Tax=Poeciliopsis prolifica TaxID=188132 RepID=A0A0S7EX18_9TELE